jgi:prepilin-type N-terminal cleavage/methylation domain-containing protein
LRAPEGHVVGGRDLQLEMSGCGFCVAAVCDRRLRSIGGQRPARQDRTRGFSLIELMVVIALMLVLMGGIGLAVAGRGGEGAALANAQSIVASLVGATRAQAVLHQTRARLVVYAQMPPAGDAGKYLRTLIVLREEPFDSGRYIAVGDPVTLPTPVCVVPPTPVPTNHILTGVTWNNNPATGPVSTLTAATSFSYRGQANAATTQFFGGQNQSGRVLFLTVEPDGTIASNMTKIALSTAQLSGNTLPLFNNASRVRGLFVRRSGAVSLVDEATGF